MPTYVYECAKCGDEFELWQSFSDEPLKKHPGCGGKVVKVLQPVGIVLKGSGFYKNDSRNGGGGRKKSDAGSKADSASKSDSKSDSKSESKSESSGSSDSSSSSSSKSDSSKSGAKSPSTAASKPA